MEVTPPQPPITQESIVENAHRELSSLTLQLERAVLDVWERKGDWRAVADVLVKLRHLDADSRLAGILMGLMSPWLPTVADIPPGTPKQVRAREPLEMGIRALTDILPNGKTPKLDNGDVWRFPDLEDAVDWLVNQAAVVTKDELAHVQQQLHREAFALDVEDVATVRRFQSALAESIGKGESLSEFRTRISDITEVTRSTQETLYRTNTKQAYLAGQTKALEQPRVRDRFRWVYYAATKDNRTRPDHWALDGMVAEVGSSLHQLMLKKQAEYNCRCTLIPLNESKAESYGVDSLSDVPAEYR